MFILASSSSTRKSLLENAGLHFKIIKPSVNESLLHQSHAQLSPIALALKLASEKTRSISRQHENQIIVGVDQVLHLENQIFHKPNNLNEAQEMLSILRGKTHFLTTAISCSMNGREIWNYFDQAKMTMRHFSNSFLESYLKQNNDKNFASVGAYQLELLGVQLFEKIEGDYFTILGFPLIEFLKFLRSKAILET